MMRQPVSNDAVGRYFGGNSDEPTRRVLDSRFDAYLVRVQPGGFYVTGAADEMILTVLGSCVAACVRNPFTGYGGLNHFMLPASTSGDWNGVGAALRYGNFAMEALINAVLKSGCTRAELEIKLFGGANMMGGPSGVGSQNAEFARDYLSQEGLTLAGADLGGLHGRRIHYSPATGKVQRLLLQVDAVNSIVEEERDYIRGLSKTSVEGTVELFD